MTKRAALFIATLLMSLMLFCLSARSAAAPKPAGLITSMSGEVQLRRTKAKVWVPAAHGDNLFKGDKIRTLNGSKATILYSDGSIYMLTQMSSITISEKKQKASKPQSSTAKLWLQLSAKTAEKPAYPAAVAGIRSETMRESIIIISPKNISIKEGGEVFLSWRDDESRDDTAGYAIEMSDGDKTIWATSTKDMYVQYSHNATALVPGVSYIWYVWKITKNGENDFGLGMNSSSAYFTIVNVDKELAELKAQLKKSRADETTVKLLTGAFYERKRLFHDAAAEYSALAAKFPEVKMFKTLMNGVNIKIGVKTDALSAPEQVLPAGSGKK